MRKTEKHGKAWLVCDVLCCSLWGKLYRTLRPLENTVPWSQYSHMHMWEEFICCVVLLTEMYNFVLIRLFLVPEIGARMEACCNTEGVHGKTSVGELFGVDFTATLSKTNSLNDCLSFRESQVLYSLAPMQSVYPPPPPPSKKSCRGHIMKCILHDHTISLI